MNGQISKSLCTLHSPDLLEVTAHSEPANRIAARILRHNAVLGPQYFTQMTPQDKERSKRADKMAATLQVGENLGRW